MKPRKGDNSEEAEQGAEARAEWESAVREEAARQTKNFNRENKKLHYQIEDLEEKLSNMQDRLSQMDKQRKKQDQPMESPILKQQAEEIADLKSEIESLTTRLRTQRQQSPSEEAQKLRGFLNDAELENERLQEQIDSLQETNARLEQNQKKLAAVNAEQKQLLDNMKEEQLLQIEKAVEEAVQEKEEEINFYKQQVEGLKENRTTIKEPLVSRSFADELRDERIELENTPEKIPEKTQTKSKTSEEERIDKLIARQKTQIAAQPSPEFFISQQETSSADDHVFTTAERKRIKGALKKTFGENNMVKVTQDTIATLDYSCKVRESMAIDRQFPRFHDIRLHVSKSDGKIDVKESHVEPSIRPTVKKLLKKFDKEYAALQLAEQSQIKPRR